MGSQVNNGMDSEDWAYWVGQFLAEAPPRIKLEVGRAHIDSGRVFGRDASTANPVNPSEPAEAVPGRLSCRESGGRYLEAPIIMHESSSLAQRRLQMLRTDQRIRTFVSFKRPAGPRMQRSRGVAGLKDWLPSISAALETPLMRMAPWSFCFDFGISLVCEEPLGADLFKDQSVHLVEARLPPALARKLSPPDGSANRVRIELPLLLCQRPSKPMRFARKIQPHVHFDPPRPRIEICAQKPVIQLPSLPTIAKPHLDLSGLVGWKRPSSASFEGRYGKKPRFEPRVVEVVQTPTNSRLSTPAEMACAQLFPEAPLPLPAVERAAATEPPPKETDTEPLRCIDADLHRAPFQVIANRGFLQLYEIFSMLECCPSGRIIEREFSEGVCAILVARDQCIVVFAKGSEKLDEPRAIADLNRMASTGARIRALVVSPLHVQRPVMQLILRLKASAMNISFDYCRSEAAAVERILREAATHRAQAEGAHYRLDPELTAVLHGRRGIPNKVV